MCKTVIDMIQTKLFQNDRNPEDQNALLEKIKTQIRCFHSHSDVQRYEELKRLKDYLTYRNKIREYEAAVTAAKEKVEALRLNYVNETLEKYDNEHKSIMEERNWGWSLFYRIFLQWPLANFHKAPWDHTEGEWMEIQNRLIENVNAEPLSLELECPHLLRAFLVFFRLCHGRTRPLSHPDVGLSIPYLRSFAHHEEKSSVLKNVVQSLSTTGLLLFPNIDSGVDNLSNLHSDSVALLGQDQEKRDGVVNGIRSFVGRMAHRAVCDMVRKNCISELKDLWYADDVHEPRSSGCQEVSRSLVSFIISLICKVVIQL